MFFVNNLHNDNSQLLHRAKFYNSMPEIEFEFFFCKKVIAPLRLTPFLQKATISPFHSLSRMGPPVFSVLFVKNYFFAKKRRSVFAEHHKYFNIVFIF